MPEDNNTKMYCINKELFNEIHKTDFSADYILPDYLPDIKSVLGVISNVRLKGTYCVQGKIEYDGEVMYDIIYLSEEGGIKQTSYKSDFSDSVGIKELDTDDTVYLTLSCADTVLRLTNPRRISLRSKIDAFVRAYTTSCIEPRVEGYYEEDDIQSSSEPMNSLSVCCGSDTGIGVSHDIMIPQEREEGVELVGVQLFPRISGLTPSNGSVGVKAEVDVIALYQTSEGYQTVTGQVQFSHVCEVECANEDSTCNAEIYIYDVTSALNTDQNGQNRVIELDFLYDVSVCCLKNETVDAVSDMYSLSHESETEYKSVDLKSLYKVYNSNVSVDEKVPLSDKSVEKIVFGNAEVENLRVQGEGQKLICTGDISVTCVVYKDGEYANIDFSVPCKIELESQNLPEKYEYTIDCKCNKTNVKSDGENISFSTEVYLTLSVFSHDTAKVVLSVNVSEQSLQSVHTPLTLYYPLKGENLWNIAKRYKTKVSDIISANSLQSTDISSHRVLVIPKKK